MLQVVRMTLIGVASAVALMGNAHANADLATKSGCLACHAVDKKVVGPAFKDVAAKYKGDKKAADTLLAKVKAGGSGNWGPVPMPPQTAPEADLKTLVAWVLSQK